MALITFQDLPSTQTPINSTNLNNNFNAVSKVIGVKLNSDFTVTNTNGESLIPFTSIVLNNDTNNEFFQLNQDNTITCKKAGLVEVSCQITYTPTVQGGNYSAPRIYKKHGNTNNFIASYDMRPYNATRQQTAYLSRVIEVEANDLVMIFFGNYSGSQCVIKSNGESTSLHVKYIS